MWLPIRLCHAVLAEALHQFFLSVGLFRWCLFSLARRSVDTGHPLSPIRLTTLFRLKPVSAYLLSLSRILCLVHLCPLFFKLARSVSANLNDSVPCSLSLLRYSSCIGSICLISVSKFERQRAWLVVLAALFSFHHSGHNLTMFCVELFA